MSLFSMLKGSSASFALSGNQQSLERGSGMTTDAQAVRLGVTSDLLRADGSLTFPGYPIDAFSRLDGLDVCRVDLSDAAETSAGCDLLLSVPREGPLAVLGPRLDDGMTAVIRLGVGYEDCDVDAMTRKAIALVIPSEATRRSTAIAALTLILALMTRLIEKHELTLAGPELWDRRAELRGRALDGKLLGLVGCGTIGRDLITIASPLGLRFAISDPSVDDAMATRLGARSLALDELLATADIVSLHCPLSRETHHLLDARRLSLLKPTCFLVNTARGGLIDQHALAERLKSKQLAGAALDVFETEPPDPDDPIRRLDNVILSAHALNWTEELDEALGRMNVDAVRSLIAGEVPSGIVNKSIVHDPRFLSKLRRLARVCQNSRSKVPALTEGDDP
jgi:D-3-phosphoglycerate dehydrogenase